MFDEAILRQAAALLGSYQARGWRLATAESCTGGLVAGALTEIAGSSAVVERGFVTYSNEAKSALLRVPAPLIAEFGAVSEPVARKMAEGALNNSLADVAVAVTGIAGPGGGSAVKPVGLVHFACARKDGPTQHIERRFGEIGRTPIRLAALKQALDLLEQALHHEP
ncbi:CinA family protein [Methylovirgula sp. 4M-Z18]|uniref:CinA family protein n=1 Tax=Methylovirgula sp. 4M-Z18 TaxID=2293567 RepID=UPI000E2F2EB0|nr:CinA family protein [Methylovirgula sp. 4M-Z18]RFB80244.1 CinA family protein [Methylovirgula sp. 4M-Z18]